MADDKPVPISLDWEAFCATMQALEKAGIPHMIVGSIAAAFHGLGRSTHDLDLVTALNLDHISRLVEALKPDFYVDMESVETAVRNKDMFNAIHYEGGFKIDFWVLEDDEFSTVQFERRQCVSIEGVNACIATAEDTILSKLKWYKLSHSERQLSDVKEIVFVNRDTMDTDYLKTWANKLGVERELSSLLEEN